MPTTPDRVRELIQASGLSKHAFALGIGLDASKLSKSLAGTRRFTSLDLARIAEARGVTVDWLITGEEPGLAMAARTSGGSAAAAIREARRLSGLRTDMAFLGHPQSWHPVTVDQRGRRHADHGATLAAAARERLRESGRSSTEPDLAGVIEAVFGADVAVADLGVNFDGLAVSSDDVKLILVATSQLPTRQRFTLVHELGHLLAGDDQELHVDQNIDSKDARKDPSELRANAFAAAFLMPEGALRAAAGSRGMDETSFATLAYDLGVSPLTLAYRLQNLRLIDAGTCDRFRAMSATRAANLAGHGEDFARLVLASGSPRPPGPLVRDTYLAYDRGEATLRPYAALIGADVDALRSALESEALAPT